MTDVVLDIETNMTHDHVWCAVTSVVGDPDHTTHVHTDAQGLRSWLTKVSPSRIIGHNLIGFDVPVLLRTWDLDLRHYGQIYDTLVACRLIFPSPPGGHSLANWAKLLGLKYQKQEFSDFDGGLTEEMIEYCEYDVLTNAELFEWTLKEAERTRFSPESLHLEHEVAWIIAEQERNGFFFDSEGAFKLYKALDKRMKEIERELQAVFPPIVHERWSEKTGKRLKDRVEVFNPGSRQQVAARLAAKGAKFKEKTPTGHPKVSETTLKELNMPEADLVEEYMRAQKKHGLCTSWFKAVQADGRIHGRVISNGTVTGRMTHTSPNLAQIPSDADCRQLFTVPSGYKLVGCDASGLELRMLAHYMQDEEYTKAVIEGKQEDGTDVHTRNQLAAGLPTRHDAKTFIYAFLYGAGDGKIGSIIGGGARQGAEIKDKFLAQVPALAQLQKKLEKIKKASRTTIYNGDAGTSLPGLDGRRLWIRHDHAALNTLLQGAGAVVMKKALVIAYRNLVERGLDFKFVANVHDEWQVEARADHAEEVGEVLRAAIVEAGEILQLRCPLDGEYHVGTNWSETH